MRIYTGVGSRETPDDVAELMRELARRLAAAGWTLRSGGADGADTHFEVGCDSANGEKEVYLAWKGFNGRVSKFTTVSAEALELAATIHPAWERLGTGPRKLHGRNMYQVLGFDLQTKSEAVICWTKDGCESRKQRSNQTGGTASAIVLAAENSIPVFNLKNPASRERLQTWLECVGVSTEGLALRDATPKQDMLF